MDNTHVLIVPSFYPTWYAPVRGVFFRKQAEALRNANMRVGVVYPEHRSLRTVAMGKLWKSLPHRTIKDEEGIITLRSHGWNLPNVPVIPGRFLTGVDRLRGLILRKRFHNLVLAYIDRVGRPDIIHAHGLLWGGVAARDVGKECAIPYIVTAHSTAFARGLIQPWQEPHLRNALQDASASLAVSRSLSRLVAPYAGDIAMDVVPNVVDTSYFRRPSKPRSSSPFTFLVVAHLRSKKGIDVLLKAFAHAFSGDEHVTLEVGGDGPERGNLVGLAKSLGIADQVYFRGALSHQEVRDAMWKANIFVLPSYVETFGVVVIEAVATGLPVIATRSGGPEEIITPESGWLTEPGDVAELSTALVDAHKACTSGSLNGDDVRSVVVKKYGESALVENLLSVYQEAVKNHKP